MAQQHIRKFRKLYSPAAVGSDETVHLFAIKKGDRILWGDVLSRVSAAGGDLSTIALQLTAGAGGASGGLLAAKTTVVAAGTIFNLNGADLAASGGIIATADGTVDAVYTHNTNGATDPVWEVTLMVAQREQIA